MQQEAVLANSVGTYLETAPEHALRDSFQCAWVNHLPDEQLEAVTVVPDGCIDLIWRGGRLSVVGPDVSPARPDLQGGDTVLGVRFQPGAASLWLNLPISEIVGLEVDMQDIWGERVLQINAGVNRAGNTEQKLLALQEWLGALAPSSGVRSKHGAAIFGFLRKNATGESSGGIGRLVAALDTSERSLRRKSKEIFGYGPKTLHRILRLQALIASVRKSHVSALADLAYENGYSDQAHLNREIQSLCGMTAGELARQLSR